jgi:hypothetical protein
MSQSPHYPPVPPFAQQPAKNPLPLWSVGIGVAAFVLSWVPVLLAMSGFSRKGLIEQLESDAGEGFTHSQAVYGVTKAGL